MALRSRLNVRSRLSRFRRVGLGTEFVSVTPDPQSSNAVIRLDGSYVLRLDGSHVLRS